MKTKAFAFFTLAVLVLNLTGLTFADTRRTKSKKRQSNSLVALLPASDGVATFDTKRFFNDALPKVLSANQPMLGKIMAHVNEMSNSTGIDLRKFDHVAVGIAMKMFFETKNVLIVAASVALGGVIGKLIGIDVGLTMAADWARHATGAADKGFNDGLVTAIVLFCVGPMTLMGCLQEAIEGKIELFF